MSKRIETTDLNVYYGDFRAVEDVTITIQPRAVTAFIGPSGCGKSTLLRTLNRMHEVIPGARVEGEVLLDGENLYGAGVDPVRVRRAQVAKWTLLANRVGYLFVALSIALFIIAFAVGFSSTLATLVIISFVIGCVLLAPSIILGYAVKAAERDDRERGF